MLDTDCLHQSSNVFSIFEIIGGSNEVEHNELEMEVSQDLNVSCQSKIIVQTRANVILGLPKK